MRIYVGFNKHDQKCIIADCPDYIRSEDLKDKKTVNIEPCDLQDKINRLESLGYKVILELSDESYNYLMGV